MDQGCKILSIRILAALNCSSNVDLALEYVTLKGKPRPSGLSMNQLKSRYARKNIAGLLNRLPRTQPSHTQRGSTLEYLIGQQRRQSMPQPAPKSRANLNYTNAKGTCVLGCKGPVKLGSPGAAGAFLRSARLWFEAFVSRAALQPAALSRSGRPFCTIETLFPPNHDGACNSNGGVVPKATLSIAPGKNRAKLLRQTHHRQTKED